MRAEHAQSQFDFVVERRREIARLRFADLHLHEQAVTSAHLALQKVPHRLVDV
jgi:hypothetical protein